MLECRTLGSILLLAVLGGGVMTASEVDPASVRAAVERAAATPHPRLVLTPAVEARLREALARDARAARFAARLAAEAEAVLELEPLRRDQQEGRRLLGVSREVLRRVLLLGLAYRLAGDPRHLERARRELRAVAAFADWNPSHWLDVAEMATAVAFGYDWLHDALDAEDRALLLDALERHAFAVYRPNRSTNNWNDVCNGAMIVAALAVADRRPQLAADTIAAAVDALPRALAALTPEGAHPEGGAYWHYATLYSVTAIAALESAAGTDLGLVAAHPGWLASGGYYAHLHGPSGWYYNYGDPGHSGQPQLAPQLSWLARRAGRPEWSWNQGALIDATLDRGRELGRMAPLLLAWSEGSLEHAPPEALDFASDGVSAIALHRTAWSPEAGFVGVKGGSASANHAHMDAGSFVYEVDGQRWAPHPGAQGYHALEARGIDVFGRGQDAQRWTIFRMNNRSHSTLVVDDQLQRVDGRAALLATGRGWSVLDLAPVYAGQLAAAARGLRLLDDRRLVIRDELRADADGAQLRWALLTRATVETAGGRALLRQGGQTLELRVLAPAGVVVETWDSATPPRDHDDPNPGTSLVGFRLSLAAGEASTLRVALVPAGAAAVPDPEAIPLADWASALPAR